MQPVSLQNSSPLLADMVSLIQASNSWLIYLATVILSSVLCMSAIPRIIYISKKKKIYDLPDSDRKVHKEVIPNLGGIAIFLGLTVSASVFINSTVFTYWNYITASLFILFLTGIKDDIINVNPTKKFIAQLAASFIIAIWADLRLDNLYGLFGLHELPYALSVFITIIGYTFISNAFNLIDGVDGLAGTIAVITTFSLGVLFALMENFSAAVIAFSVMGAVIGFLRYNYSPARIFMGDSGSLVIGFVIAVLSVILTDNMMKYREVAFFHNSGSVLLVALAILFIPIFDTFRVFITRIAKGNSPFDADRTHLHHYLLDLGFSHSKTVLTLALANVLIICLAFAIQDLPINIGLAILILSSVAMFSVLYFFRRSKINARSGIKTKKSRLIF